MDRMILIVDDNVVDLSFVKSEIENNTVYKVVTVDSGKEVLAYVKENAPDVLIIGISKADTGNLQVMETMRIRKELQKMPIIVIAEDRADSELEDKCFESGAFDFIAGTVGASTLIRKLEKAMEYGKGRSFKEESEQDYLTGLHNRRFAERAVAEKLKSHKGTFFLIDVDNFKHVNDIFGHAAGDEVLKITADILKENAKVLDIIFRLGGDEYGIYSPEIETAIQAKKYAMGFIEAYTAKKADIPNMKKISLSIGATLVSESDKTFEDLYMRADKALYFVKQNGRNSFYCYSENDSEKKKLSALGRKTELQRFADLLTSYQNKNGVFEVGYREFENVFEMASRFTKRNQQKLQLLLFTLVSVDEENENASSTAMAEETIGILGDTINHSLRRVDVCVRFSPTQYLVALIDTRREYIEVVTDRIMQEFYKVYRGKEYIVTFDIADIK